MKVGLAIRAMTVVVMATIGPVACKSGQPSSPAIQQTAITQKLKRGEITRIVNASGTVRPELTIQIGSEISGEVIDVKVDFNSKVKKGDILAVINPDKLENEVTQNQARVENRQSDIKINMAALKRARINFKQAQRSLDRRAKLFAENAISKSQLEETERTLALAEADVTLTEARLDGAKFALRQAQADLETSKSNLSRTIIRAPIDGVIIERAIDPGQTVAASFSAPKLFKIAADLSHLKLEAEIIESDIAGLDAGDRAIFTVDAYPSRQFEGVVEQLRLQSQNKNNIVTYTAVIAAENPEYLLLPGMTAALQITTHVKPDVLKLPTAAERFRPSKQLAEKWQSNTPKKPENVVPADIKSRLQTLKVNTDLQNKIFERIRSETQSIRENLNDPTKSWSRNRNAKLLLDTISAIIKEELPAPKYQDYLTLMRANQDTRRATVWVKADEGYFKKDVVLGLSDGKYVEVVSGLKAGDSVVTGLSSPPPTKPKR